MNIIDNEAIEETFGFTEVNDEENDIDEVIDMLIDIDSCDVQGGNNKNKSALEKVGNTEKAKTKNINRKTSVKNSLNGSERLKEKVTENIQESGENFEDAKNKSLRDYIKMCNTLSLIPSWNGFEKYYKL